MSRQQIDHRRLLESVLPRQHLPTDVQALVDRALHSDQGILYETAARHAIASLVERGILVATPAAGRSPEVGSAAERYLNRETGDTILVNWSRTETSGVIKLPLTSTITTGRVRAGDVAAIVTLGDEIYEADGTLASSYGRIIGAALSTISGIVGADYVAFVPSRVPANGTTIDAEVSVSPDHARLLATHVEPGEHALLWAPDLSNVPDFASLAPGDEFASVAIATVRHPAVPLALDGFIEIWSREADAFDSDQLLAIGLLAGRLAEAFRKAEFVERLAFHDGLTGLYNRSFFNIQLEKEMARARRAGDSFALAIADIDDFRAVNARYGYYGGNDLLVQVARLLEGSVRPFDIVARWGGEEFALILTPPVGVKEAEVVCNRIREAVATHPFAVTGLDLATHSLTLSVSIGVSIFPGFASTGKQLWATSNTAVQLAKRQGKNRVIVYERGVGPGEPAP